MISMIFKYEAKMLCVFSLILTCGVLPINAAEPASEPAGDINAPVIHPAAPIHDFGTTWASGPMQHSFSITNTGKVALEISRVAPACGCTTVGEYPKRLEPGKEGKFSFTLDSQKLYGVYTKLISIYSNDPHTPELKLTLKGECKHYIELTPYTGAAFGRINGNEATSRTVTIKNNTEEPLKLELRPPDAKSKFKYELVEKEPGKLFELHVTATPPLATGMVHDTVTLTTNNDKQKTVLVEVVAVVPERLEVMPNVITINTAILSTLKTNTTQTITFMTNGGPPVKVLEALVDDPAIKVGVDEQDPGKRYTISVLIPPKYVPPDTGRTVVIRIEDSEKPFILVPIRTMQAPLTPTPCSVSIGTAG